MGSFKMMVVGCVLAGGCGFAWVSPVQAAAGKGPATWAPIPAEVCSAASVAKHYTLADPDFAWVRDRLNAVLDRVTSTPGGHFRKAVGHRIDPDAVQFGLKLDYARCETETGPLDSVLLHAGAQAGTKECHEAGCEDPLPGWTAPEGSTLALWTCKGNVFREVVYERVNGTWRVKSINEVLVASCDVAKEPEDGRLPGDGK